MKIREIINRRSGRKWEIFKDGENNYSYKYYERFSYAPEEWRLTATETPKKDSLHMRTRHTTNTANK
jgi:hypothetical protein